MAITEQEKTKIVQVLEAKLIKGQERAKLTNRINLFFVFNSRSISPQLKRKLEQIEGYLDDTDHGVLAVEKKLLADYSKLSAYHKALTKSPNVSPAEGSTKKILDQISGSPLIRQYAKSRPKTKVTTPQPAVSAQQAADELEILGQIAEADHIEEACRIGCVLM